MFTSILLYRFTSVPAEVLYLLAPPLQEAYGLPVHAVQRPLHLTARGHYPEREQWLARQLLEEVAEAPPATGLADAQRAARLGVAGQDLFATGLNFVFGEASKQAGVAVMSIARLDDHFYGLPHSSADTFHDRCATEAVHEMGHVFGLPHCRHPHCVMWFSNTLEETDAKGWRLCGDCQRRLAEALGRRGEP